MRHGAARGVAHDLLERPEQARLEQDGGQLAVEGQPMKQLRDAVVRHRRVGLVEAQQVGKALDNPRVRVPCETGSHKNKCCERNKNTVVRDNLLSFIFMFDVFRVLGVSLV